MQDEFTSVDDFAKHRRTVGSRTIPPAVAELPLALLDGRVKTGCYSMENAGVLSNQLPLSTA